MKPMKGYYSIIQFCPDRAKLEVANIGVALFVPEIDFLNLKLTSSNTRIHRFFGRTSFSLTHLNFLKESIQTRLRKTEKDNIKSIENLEHFINTRANNIVLSSPRPIKVEYPEKELEDLFLEFTDGQAKTKKSKVLFPELDHTFKTRLHDKIRFNEAVEIPGLSRTISIPYAYQNGRLNLIHPQEFGPQGVDTGLKLAAEGRLIQNISEGIEKKLIILPKITEKVESPQEMRSSLSGLFERFDLRTVWEEEIDQLVQEVEQQSH